MSHTTDLAQNPLMEADEHSIINAYQSIERRISAVCDAVETPVLLDLDQKDLNMRAGDRTLLDVTGTTEAASLRDILINNQTISEKLELDFHHVQDLDSSKRFGIGRINNRQVLTEFFDYYEDPGTGEPYNETVQQLERMAQVLCHSKRPSYHILPCVGYVHDKFASKFGLVFEPPFQCRLEKGPVTLLNVFDHEPIVPLGHRIKLAHALCAALESFHRVGWVHKEIRSGNVAFMPLPPVPEQDLWHATAQVGNFDVALPWLFGFEYARAEAAGTRREEDHSIDNNLYRHPDRWGRPLVDFTKAHDIYSLGVVLYEIAIWRSIKAILKVQERQRIPSDYVKAHIEKACRKKVPHQVGEVLASAIRVCIGFEQETKDMNQYQVQSFFQKMVVERLQKIVGWI
ncbi:MOSC domain-containing protein [Neofusicoccum parvum]|nr:MOSC domain-containing protein [Neofusicoccum parvum]